MAKLEFKVSRNKRKIERKTPYRKIPDNPGGLTGRNGGNGALGDREGDLPKCALINPKQTRGKNKAVYYQTHHRLFAVGRE